MPTASTDDPDLQRAPWQPIAPQKGSFEMAQFDVEGTWTLQQTTGHTVELNIAVQRPDGEFGATAKVLQGGNLGAGFGRVENEQFRVTIGWNGGSKGVYIGEFDTSGVLNGATFDVAHPEVHAGWKSTRAFSRQ